jgi:hypothetical protein
MRKAASNSHNLSFLYGEVPKLTLRQKLEVAFTGQAFVRWIQPSGYAKSVPVYVVKCGHHGLFLDSPHGFDGYFSCSACLQEWLEKMAQEPGEAADGVECEECLFVADVCDGAEDKYCDF